MIIKRTIPTAALTLFILSSCAENIFPVGKHQTECIRLNKVKVTSGTRFIIDSLLIQQIDTRRRKFNESDYCTYYNLTTNRKYSLVTIFDEIGNHTSPVWVILTDKRAVVTKLDKFQMAKDSITTFAKVIASANKVYDIDSLSKKELILFMVKDARFYSFK